MHPIRAHASLLFVTPALAVLLVAIGCGGGSDCRGTCDSSHVTCRQRCTDDACRTACDLDLNNCSGRCTPTSTTNSLHGDGG